LERITHRAATAGALAFNAMLDRLGDSLQRLSAFSSDLAHELRTPISNLMTQTQVTLSRERETGRIPGNPLFQSGRVRTAGPHDRRHAVPGQGRATAW
jgi:signal transduction histidine kinase